MSREGTGKLNKTVATGLTTATANPWRHIGVLIKVTSLLRSSKSTFGPIPRGSDIQDISALFDLVALAFAIGNLVSFKGRNLKSASPQVPVPDNELIAIIFQDQVIIVAGDKLVGIQGKRNSLFYKPFQTDIFCYP